MPLGDELDRRYADHVENVRAFFRQFYAGTLPERIDRERDAFVLEIGPARDVAIQRDFFDEYAAGEVIEKLTGWNVAHLSRTLPAGATLSVTAFGPERGDD